MTERSVAIVGSGIVGTTIAYLLASKGYYVEIFEKGPEYPYPHTTQFLEQKTFLYDNPVYRLSQDLQDLALSGDYGHNLNHERHMVVGGTATHWDAVTLRMTPHDFKTRSLYGYGDDWPITYDDLEPYYCGAEAFLGVSGTDTDNPFAPQRSRPYPLPPFELSYDDLALAERLRKHGIVLHTTPQARTRAPYEKRLACQNIGACEVCPIGVRYSPNYHLIQAVETGLCKVHKNTSVRRIVLDRSGRARALVYQPNDGATEMEHAANVIIVAAGAIESARLLLLSSSNRHPDGIRVGEHVGRHLMFHHAWPGRLHFKESLLPGSIGPHTGQTHQFLDPPGRAHHGGVKVELSSDEAYVPDLPMEELRSGSEIVAALKPMRHWRVIWLQAETIPSKEKYVTLSEKRDRLGDPFAHVHYESADFHHESYRFARQILDRFVTATGADDAVLRDADKYTSAAHHMGTCRMGSDIRNSVVDQHCKIHESPNLFVVGGSNFVSPSAVTPTLTMVALAIRTADYLLDQLL